MCGQLPHQPPKYLTFFMITNDFIPYLSLLERNGLFLFEAILRLKTLKSFPAKSIILNDIRDIAVKIFPNRHKQILLLYFAAILRKFCGPTRKIFFPSRGTNFILKPYFLRQIQDVRIFHQNWIEFPYLPSKSNTTSLFML